MSILGYLPENAARLAAMPAWKLRAHGWTDDQIRKLKGDYPTMQDCIEKFDRTTGFPDHLARQSAFPYTQQTKHSPYGTVSHTGPGGMTLMQYAAIMIAAGGADAKEAVRKADELMVELAAL